MTSEKKSKTPPKNLLKVVIFKAKDGWRWHMKRSGRIVAESGEGYQNKSMCRRSLSRLLHAIGFNLFCVVDWTGKKA